MTEITVTQNIGRIAVVNQPSTRIIVTGFRGPAGADGAGGSAFDFTQSTPSALWTINHNLGRKPVIALFSVGGVEIVGNVVHTSDNQALADFTAAIAGSARCV